MKKNFLWLNVVERLKKDIVEKNFNSGDIFYTIRQICNKYRVSTITAQRAFSELEREGWIRKYPGRGTVVLKNNLPVEIKVFLPEIVHPVIDSKYIFSEILSGLSEAVQETNSKLVKFTKPYFFLNGFEKNNCFIIFQEFEELNTDKTYAVFKNGKNYSVVVHAYSENKMCSSVGIDFKKGFFSATKHLISLGHRRIGFVSDMICNPWYTARFEGYLKALRRSGIRFDWKLVKETNENPALNYKAMDEFFMLEEPPTAIVAGNDMRALYIIEYCQKHNIRIPSDLSLIGFDNIPEGAFSNPPLTTMDTRLKEIGKIAVYLVLDLFSGKKKSNENILISPQLVLRESTTRNKEKKKINS